MAKGQQKKTREAKKPKKVEPKVSLADANKAAAGAMKPVAKKK